MSTPSVYRGRSVEELIPQIEAELGPDAIVLRRRTGLTGGIGGFFQRPFAEVEAQPGGPRVDLYDEAPDQPVMPPTMQNPSVQPSPDPQTEQWEQPAAYARPRAGTLSRPAGAYVSDSLAALAAAGPDSFRAPEPFTAALAAAEHSLGETEPPALPDPSRAVPDPLGEFETFEPLQAELRRIDPPALAPAPSPPAAPVPQPRSRVRASIERGLLDLGVSEQFAQELIDSAGAHVQPFAPRLSLIRAVHRGLAQSIPVCSPLPAASASIALVGSGGSGKTSCCAALLGAYRKGSTLPASCATIVTGSERDELALLLSPLIMAPTALTSTAATRALTSARERGLLLLDTPPLSPADRPAIRRLAVVLAELSPDRIVLALPATLGARAAAQLLEALAPLGASAVAITHVDETDQLGVAVEVACRFGLAPEYIVDRGRARGGLTRIDPSYLADKLLAGAA
jgi:flagellar biosynthesis GTPase FlhF